MAGWPAMFFSVREHRLCRAANGQRQHPLRSEGAGQVGCECRDGCGGGAAQGRQMRQTSCWAGALHQRLGFGRRPPGRVLSTSN
eukprot:148425-Chlamydomonas_euryale.AAC.2